MRNKKKDRWETVKKKITLEKYMHLHFECLFFASCFLSHLQNSPKISGASPLRLTKNLHIPISC